MEQPITPEYIGSRILNQLKQTGERHLSVPITKAVMSVPAEFDERQRNYTRRAAALAGRFHARHFFIRGVEAVM